MSHPRATDEVLDTVALYVLGALPDGERAAFERHLAEGCATCEREVAALGSVVAELGHLTPARAPLPAVRQRLLARLAGLSTLVRAAGGGWSHPSPGVETRLLHRDASDGRATSLVRLRPGARHPGDRHATTQEVYVLEGTLTLGGEQLGAGDYCASSAEAVPGEMVSGRGGAFVLVATEPDQSLSHLAGSPARRPGLRVVRATEGAWHPGAGPGIETRQLWRDRTRGTSTALVRMAPGAHLPGHRHVTAEQLYLLAGDALVDGLRLGPGDYYRTAAGTAHDVTHTERGCEFLLIASAVEPLG